MNEYFTSRRSMIEDRLDAIARSAATPPALQEAFRSAMRSAGKRVRGTLTVAVGEACGAKVEKLLDSAAAFEMIHACSLILDDLPSFDDAEVRRGEPTLHRTYGEDLAILSAVGLLNHSYALIGQNFAALTPRRWNLVELLERVTAAVGWDGTIGGEAVDLHSEAASLDFDTLEYIHSRKTGALFVAAAATGAMLANASPSTLRAVEAYAKNLGLAFQITDDILDVTATRESLGKDVGKDTDRLTFVKLAGVEGARRLTEELIDTSIAALTPLGRSAKNLQDLALVVRDRTK